MSLLLMIWSWKQNQTNGEDVDAIALYQLYSRKSAATLNCVLKTVKYLRLSSKIKIESLIWVKYVSGGGGYNTEKCSQICAR